MKKKKLNFQKIKSILPYFLAGAVILGVVFAGTMDKNDKNSTLSLNTFENGEYKISVDQISELYTVADLSHAMNLASSDSNISNYVMTTAMYKIGQTSSDHIDKGTILDSSKYTRGVISYVVSSGETMSSIAKKFGLTTDQIRWSNNLRTTDLNAGATLYLPNVPGIVYKVKIGDTIESIAKKCNSTASEIIALNDLELTGISKDLRIVIKGGVLPETERPEYISSYTYAGSYSNRNIIKQYRFYDGGIAGNSMVPGQCTWYAWWWRKTQGAAYGVSPLPEGSLGNAGEWAWKLGNYPYYFQVDKNPTAGSVFQTSAGSWTGHVGIVLEVLGDTLHTTEMNWGCSYWNDSRCTYLVTEAYMPYSTWRNFNFIH